eukprot:3535788-Rhodomonas_salina.2
MGPEQPRALLSEEVGCDVLCERQMEHAVPSLVSWPQHTCCMSARHRIARAKADGGVLPRRIFTSCSLCSAATACGRVECVSGTTISRNFCFSAVTGCSNPYCKGKGGAFSYPRAPTSAGAPTPPRSLRIAPRGFLCDPDAPTKIGGCDNSSSEHSNKWTLSVCKTPPSAIVLLLIALPLIGGVRFLLPLGISFLSSLFTFVLSASSKHPFSTGLKLSLREVAFSVSRPGHCPVCDFQVLEPSRYPEMKRFACSF